MINKVIVLLIGIIGILLALFLIIRGEFIDYLGNIYPDQSFKIGFTKIDPIYGRFYARVTCLNDETSFSISRPCKRNKIHENYLQCKSVNQYNSKIESVFGDSDIKYYIKNVTGGGEMPFKNDGVYNHISIMLTDDAEPISAAKRALYVLKENNISAMGIIFRYERDMHVYEIHLSPDDYALNENELEAKVERIK